MSFKCFDFDEDENSLLISKKNIKKIIKSNQHIIKQIHQSFDRKIRNEKIQDKALKDILDKIDKILEKEYSKNQ